MYADYLRITGIGHVRKLNYSKVIVIVVFSRIYDDDFDTYPGRSY